MQSLDFYQLPRSAQDRFIDSVNGVGLPAPILRTSSLPLPAFAWLGASVASMLALIVVFRAGFGNVASGMARQGAVGLVTDMLLVGFATFAMLRAALELRNRLANPFRYGLYLFPVGLIDARTTVLSIYPIEDLAGVYGPDARGLTLDFGGQSFAFPVKDPTAAETARADVARARSAMGEAGGARESVRPKAVAELDPLQGYPSPFAPDPIVPTPLHWARFAWAFAGVAGLVVGASWWAIRNARSDEAMYAAAVAANDSEAYRSYLEKGSRHATEVSSLLLPRALLHDAERVGTVDAIEQFIKDHPQPGIAQDAAAAHKVALLAELDVAIAVGTVAALDEFARHHPHGQVDAEWAAARHRVYEAAYAKYLAAVTDAASPAALFVQRLLSWAERAGPNVVIRFRGRASPTLEKADTAVAKSRQFKGSISLPSRYFDEAAQKSEEAGLATAISQRFADVFPAELLAVTVGDPIMDPDAPLPASIAVPTLFIEHNATWAGWIQAIPKPRGVFVGLKLSFEGLFRVPDETKPVRVKLEGWYPPDTAGLKDAEAPEQAVYAGMRGKAVEQFQKKLLGVLFPGAK